MYKIGQKMSRAVCEDPLPFILGGDIRARHRFGVWLLG